MCCGGSEHSEHSEHSEDSEHSEHPEHSRCRPVAFLLALPFAFIALQISFIGGIVWILGRAFASVCRCCSCITILIDLGLAWIKAPVRVMLWFTSKIPC